MNELERMFSEAVVTSLKEQPTHFTVENEERNKKYIRISVADLRFERKTSRCDVHFDSRAGRKQRLSHEQR